MKYLRLCCYDRKKCDALSKTGMEARRRFTPH